MFRDVSLVALMLSICALFVVMGWVGWRFFWAQGSVSHESQVKAAVVQVSDQSVSVWGMGANKSHLALLWMLIVGAGVVGAVLMFSESIAPEPLLALEMDRQAHIQGALNPERLVPPPALPPSLFVGSERPALETADRDWGRLNPVFTQLVLRVLARLEKRGYVFVLLEGYRSPERQEKLADMGAHVTGARAFQSKHQFGLAVDLAPMREGRLVISEREPWAMAAYQALGEESEKLGLVWGGRWWFKDYGHVEIAGSLAAISRGEK